MSHKKLRLFIVKVSVLGYFPLPRCLYTHVPVYLCTIGIGNIPMYLHIM